MRVPGQFAAIPINMLRMAWQGTHLIKSCLVHVIPSMDGAKLQIILLDILFIFLHFACSLRVGSCFLRDAARITVDGDVGGGWRLNVFRFHKYNNPMCVSLFFTVNRQRNWSWGCSAVQSRVQGWMERRWLHLN